MWIVIAQPPVPRVSWTTLDQVMLEMRRDIVSGGMAGEQRTEVGDATLLITKDALEDGLSIIVRQPLQAD
ncbi:hypothetical protein TW86_21395 [Halomonas sp. S2151]|nr:hypothetical protein TW86_21395 [Halomonas sp. S2151]